MPGGKHKVLVGRQQRQLVAYAELSEQGIDGSHLHARPAAGIADSRRANVIFPVWLDERQGGKALDDLLQRRYDKFRQIGAWTDSTTA